MTDQIGTAIARAAEKVDAPPELRERIARAPERGGRAAPRAIAVAAVAALALAAAFLVLPGGAPSVEAVASAGLNPPERAAQVPAGGFPDLEDEWGWDAVGARTDTVDGREAKTVIYRSGESGVHYSIVDEELPLPDGKRRKAGERSVVVTRDGPVNLVSWHEDGRTCILASQSESGDGLVDFASW